MRLKLSRWLLLSLLHPLATALLVLIFFLSVKSKILAGVALVCVLLVYLINLPGILILEQWGIFILSLHGGHGGREVLVGQISAATLITWLLVVLPLCSYVAFTRRYWF